jgi:hypothetical protein
MKFVVIDFETASACDLKKAGAWVYSEHPTTEIICLGAAYDDGGVEVHLPDDLRNARRLFRAVCDPDTDLHRSQLLLREIHLAQHHGAAPWMARHPRRAVARHDGVVRDEGPAAALERVSQVLRLATQKDTDGTKITLAFSRTNKKGYYDRAPDKIASLHALLRPRLHRATRTVQARPWARAE